MRIISGINKGTKLKTLVGDNTRPTLDRVKESIFNIIFSKGDEYKYVLDLFSGSGALGLEMLSRGSEVACFCDNSKEAINVITENIKKCRQENKARILNLDYIECLKKFKKENYEFDLIFLDPPYDKGIGIKSIEYIDNLKLLKEDGIIVLETSLNENVPEILGDFKIIDERKYGKIKIYMFMRKG